MKILLRENVRNLGTIGEVVDVKPGYARNYLLPEGKAVQPSPANVARVERAKAAYLAQVAREREELQARANALEGKEVTITARANEEGHLYGSIGPAQIAAAMTEAGHDVHPDEIRLPEPIRQLDKYDVTVDFAEEITATIHVWVVPIREVVEGETTETVPEIPTGESPAGTEQAADADQPEASEEPSA
jgi:large subunit ribosomal protein L9